ncbi:MAG: HIT family protein [Alphaproteobacteria bacterium]|nr:HIT family protein [Alphaproteobacteria bacterium]
MSFSLHPKLQKDTFGVTELPLCTVLLMNNSSFPWLILVPRVADKRELIDLSPDDRHRLLDEVSLACEALKTVYTPDKLNVAALGNQVQQLHVHVIARFTGDAAWPNPVWGLPSKPYEESAPVIERLKRALGGR